MRALLALALVLATVPAEARPRVLWNADRRVFIAYDDPESLRVKARYIREHGLAGAMFWEYNADRTGTLLRALFAGLRGGPPETP